MSKPTAPRGSTAGINYSSSIDEMMQMPVNDRISTLLGMAPTPLTAAVITRTLLDDTSSPQALEMIRGRFEAHFDHTLTFDRSTHKAAVEVFRWCIRYVSTAPKHPRRWAHKEMSSFLYREVLGRTTHRSLKLLSAGGGKLYFLMGESRTVVDISDDTRVKLALRPCDVVIFSELDIEWNPRGKGRRYGVLTSLVLADPCDPRNTAVRA